MNALWYRGNRLYWLLWPIAIVYRGLISARRMAYRSGLMRSYDVGVPVVVVGNITVGGTGKTPLVIWIANRLRDRGFRVGIICRGYRGESGEWPVIVEPDSDFRIVGDEARLIAEQVSCPVAAGPDRVAAARLLLDTNELDLIVSDDGLQHYALKRASEIVVIDGTRNLGNGLCLPAGPLREPAERLRRVDAIVVNGGETRSARSHSANMRLGSVRELATGTRKSLEEFRGQAVHAVAGIGNPQRFFDLLTEYGLDVDGHARADHARICENDLRFPDAEPVMITAKDAVKCEAIDRPNIWCVEAELEFEQADGDRLERYLMRLLEHNPENL